MSEFRKVITLPGEVIDFETVYEENPYIRTGVPTKPGKCERLEYPTSVYEDGRTYHKYCYVYLPHGYDSEDKSKKYNVMYFQHGNTCDPQMFGVGGNKPMIDMLFESGEIEPCIMAFITYYMDPEGDYKERVVSGMVSAGDGYWPDIKGNYYKEIVEDIIPLVEMNYSTYLEDPSREGIKATRDHRGFSGYSRGGVCTWNIIHHDFEYFRWYAPMSCHCRAEKPRTQPVSQEEVTAFLTAPLKANPELPFFIFASSGNPDAEEMKIQMKYITKIDGFSYGKDPTKNNIIFAISDYYHTDFLVPYYFWNSLKVLFKGV
ncbi:MAG: hypothetical protein JW795_06995 [Chitinivibrionales bacterium]|nr:hypothetical protein [Chitinivibrionales bacterium]